MTLQSCSQAWAARGVKQGRKSLSAGEPHTTLRRGRARRDRDSRTDGRVHGPRAEVTLAVRLRTVRIWLERLRETKHVGPVVCGTTYRQARSGGEDVAKAEQTTSTQSLEQLLPTCFFFKIVFFFRGRAGGGHRRRTRSAGGEEGRVPTSARVGGGGYAKWGGAWWCWPYRPSPPRWSWRRSSITPWPGY